MTEIETLVMRDNITVHAAALFADEAETKRLCEETQKLWDAGYSFIMTINRMFGIELRQNDSQEEIDAAVEQLETKLAMVAIRKTISQMSREECTALVQAMDHLDIDARIKALGRELRSSEIRSIWNDQHKDERPVWATPGLAPEI